jgi:oxaloacetate decarboxylase gamma subunit
MLVKGVELMVIGMAVVFLFLALMVVILMLVSFVFRKFSRFFPEEEITAAGSGNQRIAAIIAAVTSHTRK